MGHVTPPPQDPEDAANLQERMQAIYVRARASFAANLATIDAAINHLETGALAEPERRAAERAAHQLAGAAGTFGFPEATGPAHQLEAAFTHDPLHPDTAPHLATEATMLRRILFGNQVPATEPQEPPQRDAQVIALHAAWDLDAQIRVNAMARGLDVTHEPGGADIEAVIVDLAEDNGESLIRGYAERRPSIPILALSDTASLADRLVAASAGASLVLPRTASPTDVVDAAQSLSRQPRKGQFRLLAVDDDPVMLAALPAVLATEPIDVTTLDDPRKFWAVLEQTGPDLVVLDLDMPHLDGIALCRIIRTDPSWSSLPVLFLTARTDLAAIDAIFAAGADDFVSKPLVASEVRARIRNRLDRVALYRTLADTDPLTGLVNRRRLESDFDRLRALARRHHQPLSMGLLDIDHFKRVNDAHGHGTGDLVLRRLADRLTGEFRGEDVVARWGGEEIAVLTFGMSGADASRRLTGILESIRSAPLVPRERRQDSVSITFSGGVAELGVHGEDLRTLTRAADAALYRAKRSGRARVVRAEEENSTRPTDHNSPDECPPRPVGPAIQA
jgi:diguanylate cyclase (GGDEF)-like protein